MSVSALASDNLDRLPPGFESDGVLWTAGANLTLAAAPGPGAARLSLGAGEEWRGGFEEDAELVYRLEGVAPWRLGGGSTLTARLESRKETEAGGDTDAAPGQPVDRSRRLTETVRGELSLENRLSAGGEVKAALALAGTDRAAETRRRGSLTGSAILAGPRDEWRMDASWSQGDLSAADRTWQAAGLDVTWARSLSPAAKAGARVTGSWSHSDDPAAERGSQAWAAFLFGSRRPSPRLSLSGSVGGERFTSTGKEAEVEGAAEGALTAALTPALSLDASLARRVEARGTEGEESILARATSLAAALSYRPRETLTLSIRGRLWQDRFAAGEAGASSGEEREDEGTTLSAGVAWKATRGFSLAAEAAWEDVKSSLPASELRESRLSLRAQAGW